MLEDTISRRRAWAVTLAATFTMTVSQLDRTTLSILAPSVTKDLHVSEMAYGWLASAFSIAYLVGSPLAGWWLDRVGARRGLLVSVVLWSLVAALHSAMLGFVSLFALRIALGIAESPGYSGSALAIQRVLPDRDRARGYGVLFTGSSIGVMIAAPLAAWLFGRYGWRTAFLTSAVVGLLWVPAWLLLTRAPAVRAKLDESHETRTTERWHDIIRQPSVLRAMLAIFASAPVTGLVLVWGAKYLVRTFSVGQKDVGHYLWIPPVMFDLASVVFGDLHARLRRAAGEAPRGLFVVATLLAMCIALTGFARTPLEGMLLLGVGLAGNAGMYTLSVADLLSRTPPSRVGITVSFLPAAQSLMVIATGPLIGWSVTRTGSYSLAALVTGLWALPGALGWLLWRLR